MTDLYSYEAISKMIAHSFLQPVLTVEELEAGCQLALRYDVASVCILPYYTARKPRESWMNAAAGWHWNRSQQEEPIQNRQP